MVPTAAEKGEEVRRRLRTAALELIPELGWEGVSTRALARRAGVAPGLVHYHFASVPAVLRVAALEQLGAMLAEVEQADDPAAMLLDAFDQIDSAGAPGLLFLETALAALRDAELRTELTTLLAGFRSVLTDRLRAAGVAHPEETAGVFAALVDGLLLHKAFNPGLTAAAVRPVLTRLLDGGAR